MDAVAGEIETDGGEAAPLDATLLTPPPEPLAVGAGTVLHVEGRCDPRAEPGSLEVRLGALRGAVEAERGDAAGGRRWWALLDVPAGFPEGEAELSLCARLGDRPVAAALGSVTAVTADPGLAPPAPSVVTGGGRSLIAICMATHEPDPDRLERQLDSIREQDWPSWVCVISDDASSAERFAALQRLCAEDERFVVSRSETRLGFYRNFERALRMTPIEADHVALCDQDDAWASDKLSALHATLVERPEVKLAYSDMRIVDERGEVLSDTYWILRRNRWDDVISLLVANTVTGAASLFRSELLADALPFPPPVAEPYHDHWLALCALAAGELAYLDRPTYDRTRHLGSVTDHTRHAAALRAMREGPETEGATAVAAPDSPARRRDPADVYRGSYLQLAQFARVAELRIGDRIDAPKRRALRRFARAERSLLAPAWLALRSLRPLVGRNETLGRERALAAALLWRRLRPRSAAPAGPDQDS